VKPRAKKLIYAFIPLTIRKWLAILINRQTWLDSDKRGWWATQIIVDFAEKDVSSYHKFLWRHHLSYAESYETNLRFGYDNLNETRKFFLSDLVEHLKKQGINPESEIKSVLDVGCSLGYLLRYIETDVFPNASVLDGNDIDKYTIEQGKEFLASCKSKANLIHADMEALENIIGDKKYDVVFGAGILLYLKQDQANKLVAKMMNHTSTMLAFTGLAHPDLDNAKLETSVTRESDKTWIHNIDKMITDAGGKIVARRWEGNKMVDGNTIYFVFAVPAQSLR